jgi:sialate O-acetylesterase
MTPSCLFNGMVAPLTPYAVRGAIWYQGEANVGNAYNYRFLMEGMIKDWRARWGEGDFPFFLVQLAPFGTINPEPTRSATAELRESQWVATKAVRHAAQAVITDLGHESDIHPTPKEPVGHRLALLAEAFVYGQKVVPSGPVYAGMKVDGDKVVLRFRHVGGGLEAREFEPTDPRKGRNGAVTHAWRVKPNGRTDVPLQDFTIAGADQKFVKAHTKIEGDTVVVWSEQVPNPVAVRYGWQNHPVGNLFNKEGLPATPFRTDDFPLAGQSRAAAK